MLKKHHLKFYKSSFKFNSNKAKYKEFFGCSGTGHCSVQWFVLLSSTLYFWGFNFFISNLFSTSVNLSDVPKGGVQVFFRHQKQQSLPLDPACRERLSVWSPADLPSYLLAKYKPKKKKKTKNNICQLHAHPSSPKEEKKNMHLETCSINNKYMPHVTPLPHPTPKLIIQKNVFLNSFLPN